MTTSIEGAVVRSIRMDTFADITDVPLVVPGGITPSGLLFDGDLTDLEVAAIWDRMTSRNDTDQAERANLRADLEAVQAASPPTTLVEALAVIALLMTAIEDAMGYWLGGAE